jgi:dephospho-CoA kinase
MAPGQPGHAADRATFGPRALRADGTLDRDWLRDRAFDDPRFRARSRALLHPLIRARSRRRCARGAAPYGILVVPTAVPKRGRRLCARLLDRVLVVDCP